VDYEPPDENGRMILELAEPPSSSPERVNGR
jgi:hypothetical protein